MDTIERALSSKESRYSLIKDLRAGCREIHQASGTPDCDVLEYLTTQLYCDWGLARYVLNHYGSSIDTTEREISRQMAAANCDEEMAFWDIIEMNLQDAVDPQS